MLKKKGLFNNEDFKTKVPLPTIPLCGLCGLNKTCNSPKMPYSGKGNKKILIVGESPGSEEDDRNIQFCGKTGKFLEETLKTVGIDMRYDCWLTNSIICHPKDNKIPTPKTIDYCRPSVIKTIKELNPNQVLILGSTPLKSIIGWLWKENPGSIFRWVGVTIPHQKLNTWISIAWHPSHVIRDTSSELFESEKHSKVKKLLWTEQLQNITLYKDKPYKEVPNFDKYLKVIHDPNDAVPYLKKFIVNNKPIAFDFETNMSKPDSKLSKIVCCSVCDGNISIAYPWLGEAVNYSKQLFESNVPKVGHNIKFEDRWCRQEGIQVNNWIWDGMIAAHVLDNRRAFCSLKFQSFINFGIDSYNDHIEPFFKSPNGNSNLPNRIKEIDFTKLLKYCALDSLLEFKLFEIQKEKLK